MKRTFTFFSDPGHVWLEVPMVLVESLKIENKISRFSFKNKNRDVFQMAYLEEDCDAAIFIKAYGEENIHFNFVDSDERSVIRDLPRFK
jgi:hypothetical protein